MDNKNGEKMNKKREYGQFFTIRNPFLTDIFKQWIAQIEKSGTSFDDYTILEPFAGNWDLIKHVGELGFSPMWDCYDIDPLNDETRQQDTVDDFPDDYSVVITNPPYLAKNSAKRQKLNYPYKASGYQDIYMYVLQQALLKCDYVAMIIPESFITQNLFLPRLMAVDSRTTKIFDDTEVPVCVAYFVKACDETPIDNNYEIYSDGNFVGTHTQLKQHIDDNTKKITKFKFNDPDGILGLYSVDGVNKRIRFVVGSDIPKEKIKISSRAFTRISNIPTTVDIEALIDTANVELEKYRNKTGDVLLTSFKGVRSDLKYRRRLSWDQCTWILNMAIHQLKINENENEKQFMENEI